MKMLYLFWKHIMPRLGCYREDREGEIRQVKECPGPLLEGHGRSADRSYMAMFH